MPRFSALDSTASSARDPATSSAPAIGRLRRVLVQLVVGAVVGASAVDVVIDGDHWPFSSYSMYAELRAPEVRMKRLYGVHDGREVELVVPRHLPPFHEARLMTAIRRLGRRDDAAAARVAALHGVLERYESLRLAGAHDGPALDAIRFYELTWPVADGAANRDQPASRRLIAEARW